MDDNEITKEYLEDLSGFIRAHRSQEGNFDKLHQRLSATYEALKSNGQERNDFAEALQETLEKHAASYQQIKEKGGSAWPEFENFVSHFEKAVTAAISQC